MELLLPDLGAYWKNNNNKNKETFWSFFLSESSLFRSKPRYSRQLYSIRTSNSPRAHHLDGSDSISSYILVLSSRSRKKDMEQNRISDDVVLLRSAFHVILLYWVTLLCSNYALPQDWPPAVQPWRLRTGQRVSWMGKENRAKSPHT